MRIICGTKGYRKVECKKIVKKKCHPNSNGKEDSSTLLLADNTFSREECIIRSGSLYNNNNTVLFTKKTIQK